jgi:hypothetical protein
MFKIILKAILAYLLFWIILAVLYKILDCFNPVKVILYTPVACSIIIILLIIENHLHTARKYDYLKIVKPLNDSVLFTSAALVSYNELSNRFNINIINEIESLLSLSEQTHFFIAYSLTTALITKTFIAIFEVAKELIPKKN